ncbi:hypothetical protein LMG23992_02932 [Cupriavidus laharis]|uniref:Type IV pilus modification protein PilV n=1 Tax=Cupriavidus laharis TaxID=151654 RepID=A0ABM8X639_9BURK|nr:type IV pilus modification protein PilV [Cupriavidus laharis]CAG9175337.1 hypothetical protein LMG23992_02932 [Cupriavidus laharis]
MRLNMRPTRRQSGASLIEVLITLVLIAIALLGMLSLQSASLRYRAGASVRYSIVDAATDLSERIRANASGLGEGSDFNAYLAALSVQPPAAPAKDCSKVVCDGNEYAAWDVAQWWTLLTTQLPGAGVASWTSPDVSAAAGTIPAGFVSYRLELYWKDPSTSDVSVGCSKVATDYFITLPGFDARGVTCATITLRP